MVPSRDRPISGEQAHVGDDVPQHVENLRWGVTRKSRRSRPIRASNRVEPPLVSL